MDNNTTLAAPARKFTTVNYDKFHDKNETAWKDPINGGLWTPYFYSKNTMKGDKPFTDRLHINLRHVKTPTLDTYLLDYEYLATDWMFIKNGLLIINLDGVENIKLSPNEVDTKVQDGGIIKEWGYYEISLDDLKRIGQAQKVEIRISGNSMHIDIDSKAQLKFLFMVKSFLLETHNETSHHAWIEDTLATATASGGALAEYGGVLVFFGYLFSFGLFPLGLIVGAYLRFAKTKNKKGDSTYTFEEARRNHGRNILIISAIITVLYTAGTLAGHK